MKNKSTNSKNISNKYEQLYLQLGECPKGMGFNPNLTKDNFGHKFTKEDTDCLGGFRDKNGILTAGVVIDETSWSKFIYDCNTRGESIMFRLTCLILNKYPNLKSGEPFSGLGATSLHANTDYLKRSGFGKVNKNDRRKLHIFKFKGAYENIYNHLLDLCNELHMTMGTVIGSLIENAYKNYNKPAVIYKEIVEIERRNAEPYMHIDRGKTDWSYGKGVVMPMPEEELKKLQKKVVNNIKKIRTRISEIRNRKRKVTNVNLNSVKMQSRQACLRKLDMAVKLAK